MNSEQYNRHYRELDLIFDCEPPRETRSQASVVREIQNDIASRNGEPLCTTYSFMEDKQ